MATGERRQTRTTENAAAHAHAPAAAPADPTWPEGWLHDAGIQGRVIAWARRLLGNHADAQDAAQEVLLKSWQRETTPDAPLAWLRRVTFNHCLDELRRRKANPVQAMPPPHAEPPTRATGAPLDALQRHEAHDRLATGLAALSDQQLAVVLAKVYEEQTFAAVAAELGISTSTAKTHYLRALQHLRDALQDVQ